MKNKNIFYLGVFSLLSLCLALRYPNTPHEIGSDGPYSHGLVKLILSHGNIPWFANPLSLLGLYPFSEVSGGITLVAITSLIFGIETEITILFVSLMLALVTVMGSLICALELFADRDKAIIASLIYISSSSIIAGTSWELSNRGYLIVFVPFLIFFIMRLFSTQRRFQFLILLCIIQITSVTIHAMHFLNIIFFLSALVSLLLSWYFKKRKSQAPYLKPLFLSTLVFIFLLSGTYKYFLLFENESFSVTENYFSFAGPTLSYFLNWAISYSMNLGILVVFGPVGLFLILKSVKFDARQWFFLVSFYIFFLFVADSKFVRPYTTILFCLLISNGLIGILKMKFRHSTAYAISLGFVAFSVIMPYSITLNDTSENYQHTNYWVDDETYNSGIYMKYTDNSASIVSNDGQIGRRVFMVSSNFILQDGGVPSYYVYGFANYNVTSQIVNLRDFNVTRILQEDPSHSIWIIDDWLGSDTWYSQLHGMKVYSQDIDTEENQRFHDYYKLEYAFISTATDFEEGSKDSTKRANSVYFNSVIDKRYKTYEGKLEMIYSL
tara:strand:- start:645 stop:2300 length:1656 start_codon:yes stop_codon:yes gene_type:complete